MNVPLLDLKPQLEALRTEILTSITEVIDSTSYILGPKVVQFEQEIATYCNSSFAVGVSSGTDALLASLMSLDIKEGDKVITTPYTFFATMGTILRTGAIPVFADIEEDSFNIDPLKIADILENAEHKGEPIKAIIPVHLYGQCANMRSIMQLSRKYNVPVIEDAAQAIGAEYPMELEDASVKWMKAGAIGKAGCFSFFPSKNLGGIGDGGMVTTSDEEFVKILRYNRNHGAEPKYYHARVGGNFRLDPIQATVLSIKLNHLENWHHARRENAALYTQFFKDAGLVDNPVILPTEIYKGHKDSSKHNYHIYNQFIIQVPKRNELRDFLLENKIGCEIYYPLCLHQQECVHNLNDLSNMNYPVAEKAAETSLALPIYPELTKDQLSYVVDTIKRFYQGK